MLFRSGPVPLPPVTGIGPLEIWFSVSAIEAIDRVAVTAPLTVSVNVFEAVALLASVTVTVKLVAELVPVGVPVIAPVDELMPSPVGSGGETL